MDKCWFGKLVETVELDTVQHADNPFEDDHWTLEEICNKFCGKHGTAYVVQCNKQLYISFINRLILMVNIPGTGFFSFQCTLIWRMV